MVATFPSSSFSLALFCWWRFQLAASLQAYSRNRDRRTVVCSDNREPVTVEVDSKAAFSTALRGEEHDRLQ